MLSVSSKLVTMGPCNARAAFSLSLGEGTFRRLGSLNRHARREEAHKTTKAVVYQTRRDVDEYQP